MKIYYSALFLLLSMSYALVGCSDFQSKVDFDSKQSTLQDHNVFGDDSSDTESFDSGVRSNNNDGTNQNDSGNIIPPVTPPVVPPVVNATPFSIPITNVCSNRQIERTGFSVSSASELKVEILKSGQLVCNLTNTSSLRSQITNNNLQIPQSCSQFVSKSEVKNSKNSPAQLRILGRSGGSWKMLNQEAAPFQVLFDKGSRVPFFGNLFINDDCDRRASPLFVDLRSNDKKGGDYLSSVEEGVQFNILGFKAKEMGQEHGKQIANNTPVQISWFQSSDFKLLVLPNEEGKILGIDQLFGDNTLGPDASFGKDSQFKNSEESGYAALVKFDGLQSIDKLFVTPKSNKDLTEKKELFKQYKKNAKKRDHMIDREDAIYHALKLWGDINSDGVAQRNELRSLKEEGIIAIDLVYDRDSPYLETDKHGNQIKFKSVVIRCTDDAEVCSQLMNGRNSIDYPSINDGSIKTEKKVIFDVWFNISTGLNLLQ